MRLIALSTLAVFGLGACATPSISSPKVCDGRDRRPANPNGVTLPQPVYSDAVGASVPAQVNVFETPAEPASSAVVGEAEGVVPAIVLSDREPG